MNSIKKYCKKIDDMSVLQELLVLVDNNVNFTTGYGFGMCTHNAKMIYTFFKHMLQANEIFDYGFELLFSEILSNSNYIDVRKYDAKSEEYVSKRIIDYISVLTKKYHIKYDIDYWVSHCDGRVLFNFGRLYSCMEDNESMSQFYRTTYDKLNNIFDFDIKKEYYQLNNKEDVKMKENKKIEVIWNRTLTIICNSAIYSCKFGSFYVTKLDDGFVIHNSENPNHLGIKYNLKYWDTFRDQLTNGFVGTKNDVIIDLINIRTGTLHGRSITSEDLTGYGDKSTAYIGGKVECTEGCISSEKTNENIRTRYVGTIREIMNQMEDDGRVCPEHYDIQPSSDGIVGYNTEESYKIISDQIEYNTMNNNTLVSFDRQYVYEQLYSIKHSGRNTGEVKHLYVKSYKKTDDVSSEISYDYDTVDVTIV